MLSRSASLAHSARAATGVVATLPAHLRDVRVNNATTTTVCTRWTTTTRRSNSLKRTTRTQTMEAEVGEAGDTVGTEAGVGNARGGGTKAMISLENTHIRRYALEPAGTFMFRC